ncbi:MAG: TOBE domain-containing protein [Chloroflexia bacterium]|nr:TOBE domain-containing protein [Chloroflexia bacterium]
MRLADGAGEVLAPANGMRPQQPVVVSVRPERLRVGRAGSLNGAENSLRGILHRRIFLGNIVREFVEVAPDLVLMAQGDVDSDPLPPGEPVDVVWRTSSSTLLAAEDAPTLLVEDGATILAGNTAAPPAAGAASGLAT